MRSKPMTLVAITMLVAIAIAVVWNFATSTESDDMRIVLLFMGVFAVVGAISITPDNFWGRRMSEYSVSFDPRSTTKRKTAKDVESTRMMLFVIGGLCVVTGIIGFIV